MTTSDKWNYLFGDADWHTLTARDGNNVLTGGKGFTWIELDFATVLSGFSFDAGDGVRWKQKTEGSWERGVGDDYKYQRVWRDVDGDGVESVGDEYDYFTSPEAIRVFGSDGDDTMVGGDVSVSFYGYGGMTPLLAVLAMTIFTVAAEQTKFMAALEMIISSALSTVTNGIPAVKITLMAVLAPMKFMVVTGLISCLAAPGTTLLMAEKGTISLTVARVMTSFLAVKAMI